MAIPSTHTSPLLDGVQGPALGAMQEPISDFTGKIPNSLLVSVKVRPGGLVL